MNKISGILIVVLQVIVLYTSFGAIKISNADGDWEDPTTWLMGSIPVDGDEIYIRAEDTVFIQSEIRFHGSGMIVTDAGALNMINGKLHLPSNSTFNITSTGKLLWTINAIGCNNNLKIGPSIMWKGCWGDITTATVFGTPLPVELVSFKGQYDGVVTLEWFTATEVNSDYFIIERSHDADQWSIVAEVNASGNSNHLVSYSWIDDYKLSGTIYYRLTQVDFDGMVERFDMIVVQSVEQVSIFNNSANNSIYINVGEGSVSWVLTDINGRQVKKGTAYSQGSGVDISTHDLISGAYILSVSNASTFQTFRFLKE